jgi:N utilization substance protein B
MGIRRKSRELALQVLYQGELAGGPEMLDFAEFCVHFQVNRKAIPYAEILLAGVQEKKEEINKLISRHAENWRLERMSVIDRNILRLAVFELYYRDDVPATVIINEAVEIAKRYSTDDSAPFINGILDGMVRAGARPRIKDNNGLLDKSML